MNEIPPRIIHVRRFPGRRLLLGALGASALGWLGLLIGFAVAPRQTLFSYLNAFSFFASITIGALGWLLVLQATGARWAVVLRRFLEVAGANAVMFLPLFIPIAIGLPVLYPWVAPESGTPAETLSLLAHKRPWLNVPFFLARTVLWLGLFTVMGHLQLLLSRRQDEATRLERTLLARRAAAVSLPIYGLTVAFAAFDWLMSLQPTFYSTIFGVYFWSGGFLAAMAALILCVALAERSGVLPPGLVGRGHYHSMGKLLFAFVCFWAYIGFSQYMLIWIGNLPEETSYFLLRRERGYQPVLLFLVFFHFVFPLFLLLPRSVKRSPARLSAMAIWILVAHWVDCHWMVMPYRGPGAMPHLADVAALLGVGGPAVALAVLRLRGHWPVPLGDPYLRESMNYPG